MLNLFTLLAMGSLDPMNWEVIKPALNFLWKGLLAIFVVICLIIIVVKLTQFGLAKAEEMKKRREENQNDSSDQNG